MERSFRTVVLACVAIAALALVAGVASAEPPPSPPSPSAPAYRVIVHAANPANRVTRKFAADAMLKKTTRWPDGKVVKPVDLLPDSSVRRVFSEEVLKRSVESVRAYWQQIVFAGRDVPPPELATDADVVKFVATHEGGLGYVSGTATLDGAKAVAVE